MRKRTLLKRILLLTLTAGMLCTAMLPAAALELDYEPSEAYRKSNYYKRMERVELTGSYHADLVAVAKTQVGYHEGNDESQLGGGNASGDGNFTEYGYWYRLQADWCAMFISWCARMANIPTDVMKNSTWATSGDFGLEFRWRDEYTPVPGDLIIFDYAPYSEDREHPGEHGDHIGIVINVADGLVYTVEGNASNAVRISSYKLDNPSIKGYGIYEDAELPEPQENSEKTIPEETPSAETTVENVESAESVEAPDTNKCSTALCVAICAAVAAAVAACVAFFVRKRRKA